ncbi:MAG: DHH family phosphoesterase [Gemmatimonadaceae bacterium]
MPVRGPVLLISDQPARFLALRRSALAGRRVHLWCANGASAPRWCVGVRGDPTVPSTYDAVRARDITVVVDLADEAQAKRVAQAVRRQLPRAPVLVIDRVRGRRRVSVRGGIAWIDEGELLADAVENVLARVATRRRVNRFRRALRGADTCAFLLQHDPDPDAIASALALREVLGRDEREARILTCGRVTRPENRALIAELGVRIDHVSSRSLAEQENLILVDVQPTYFNVELTNVAAVVDHHPSSGAFRARFKDVRPTYGASATIAAEYLLADGDAQLTRELATALLYGIITDTKSLSRSASDDDLEMFAYLFPRADHALLRRIQHPSYAPATLRRFGMALQHTTVRGGLAHAHLGRLPEDQEHVVAQLAEFCLGMEGADIAVVSGIFHDRIVMSARALWPEAKLGDRLREAFGRFGSAGGHAVMAKAVIRLDDWKRAHRVRGDRGIELSIGRAIHRALARGSRKRPSRR